MRERKAFDQLTCSSKVRRHFHTVNMVQWTDAERAAIVSLWGKIDVGEIGPQALSR